STDDAVEVWISRLQAVMADSVYAACRTAVEGLLVVPVSPPVPPPTTAAGAAMAAVRSRGPSDTAAAAGTPPAVAASSEPLDLAAAAATGIVKWLLADSGPCTQAACVALRLRWTSRCEAAVLAAANVVGGRGNGHGRPNGTACLTMLAKEELRLWQELVGACAQNGTRRQSSSLRAAALATLQAHHRDVTAVLAKTVAGGENGGSTQGSAAGDPAAGQWWWHLRTYSRRPHTASQTTGSDATAASTAASAAASTMAGTPGSGTRPLRGSPAEAEAAQEAAHPVPPRAAGRVVVVVGEGAEVQYHYEYLGLAGAAAVITPLTERCWVALARAAAAASGGVAAATGPAASGKLETIRSLGAMVGAAVIVRHIAPAVSGTADGPVADADHAVDSTRAVAAAASAFVRAVSSSGLWGVLHHADRLPPAALSDLTQHLRAAADAQRKGWGKTASAGASFVLFPGDALPMRLHSSAAFFVTGGGGSGGGDAGGLPEDLRALGRAVAVVAPDRAAILAV
ncbi:unnamed protein product, partial [Phaeothamnion confervicola]